MLKVLNDIVNSMKLGLYYPININIILLFRVSKSREGSGPSFTRAYGC